MNERVVLIGAGSAVFTRGLVADILRQGWDGEIALVDIDADALEVAERLTRKMVTARGAPLSVRATTDRREVLAGATTVICTIGVGGRRGWEQDVFIPRRFGIFQPVGDTIMPGGTSRALRMIPAMVAIARDVVELAPEALFFNYGNPMSAVCRGVRKATGANVVGLCHGIPGIVRYLAERLDVAADRLDYTALGMNHLTWFTRVAVDGQDMLPALHAIGARKRHERSGTADTWDDPFCWELFALFGAFPAVRDRHVIEYFSHLFAHEGSYYGLTPGVDVFAFEPCIEAGDTTFRDMREHAFSDAPLPEELLDRSEGEHEQVTDIVNSVRRNEGHVFSVNLPNRGQVPNLPADAVIECPAQVDASGFHPLSHSPLDVGLAGTLAAPFHWVETIVEAALEGNREKVVQALLIDGATTDMEQAHELADALLAAQADYLPQFKRGEP